MRWMALEISTIVMVFYKFGYIEFVFLVGKLREVRT